MNLPKRHSRKLTERLRRVASLLFVLAVSGHAPAGAQSLYEWLLQFTSGSSDAFSGKVQELLAQGADPNATDSEGRTPVHRTASIENSQRTLRVLLEAGGRTDLGDGNGDTPLHLAAESSPRLSEDASVDAIRALLAYKADPNARNGRGETPLHVAARTHKFTNEGVKALLRAGAKTNLADSRGDTPLHVVVGSPYGGMAVLDALLDGGADPKKQNGGGLTGLQLAVVRGANDGDVVAKLVDAGADPNRKYRNGDAPLHAAIRSSGKDEVVKALLDRGADPCVRDASGRTPWEIAGGKKRIRDALTRADGHEYGCDKQPLRPKERRASPARETSETIWAARKRASDYCVQRYGGDWLFVCLPHTKREHKELMEVMRLKPGPNPNYCALHWWGFCTNRNR